MTICLFTPTFLPRIGGTEAVTDALARQFVELGHRPVVLAPGPPADLGVPYRVCWYRKPHGLRWFPERTARALARLHAEERFDIICVNYAHPTGYGAVRFGRKAGVPVVVVSHGGDLHRSTKDRHRPHVWRRVQYAYRHADGLIAISPYIRELILEICPEPRAMVSIPNGADPASLRRPAERPADYPDERPFLLCLGNLRAVKGFDDAVAAYALACERRPDLCGLRLVVVGEGREEPSLRSQAASLGLGDRIWFAGRRMGNDKHWFLQHCLFGLMPSIEEGHPIVGLEFLACGRPIICTTNGAFDDMYDDGVNSYRVAPRDRPALAAAMIRMADSDLGRMGACSVARSESYAWPNVAGKYLAFFDTLVGSDSRQSPEGIPAND